MLLEAPRRAVADEFVDASGAEHRDACPVVRDPAVDAEVVAGPDVRRALETDSRREQRLLERPSARSMAVDEGRAAVIRLGPRPTDRRHVRGDEQRGAVPGDLCN